MKVYGPGNSDLIEVTALLRSGNDLIIKGKIMGSLPMTAVVRPEEVRKAFSLLSLKLVWFLLTFPFRGSGSQSVKSAGIHS